jgi:TetR/AcrR family transcriptional repressor of lmrAB and yxaGH operons
VSRDDSSRTRLLLAAEELLRETGMSGTGIKTIVERSGAPIGSVYHHFPGGKNQIVAESLQAHAEKSRRLFERFFDGMRPAADALRMLFDTAADGFERAGANKGCAIGTVTLDLSEADEALRELCRSTFDGWTATIERHLPWPDEPSRRSFARTVVAALEGAFILGRATRSGDPFRDAGRWLAAAAESQQPKRRKPR